MQLWNVCVDSANFQLSQRCCPSREEESTHPAAQLESEHNAELAAEQPQPRDPRGKVAGAPPRGQRRSTGGREAAAVRTARPRRDAHLSLLLGPEERTQSLTGVARSAQRSSRRRRGEKSFFVPRGSVSS